MKISYWVLTGFSHFRHPLFHTFSPFRAPTNGVFLLLSDQKVEDQAGLAPGLGQTVKRVNIPLSDCPNWNVDGPFP